MTLSPPSRPGGAGIADDGPGPLRMVTVSLLADKDYLALARTTAMHVGALLCYPLARVAELRLAVNEACVCFLDPAARRRAQAGDGAAPPGVMELSYDQVFIAYGPDVLHVTIRAAVDEGWPPVDELGWMLLRTLVEDVRVRVRNGLGELTLVLPLPSGAD